MTEHEDEKLSSLMKSLPQQPLPPGFMQRLERRRRAEAGGSAEGSGYMLPFPARVAAFALSCLIVSLVVYDNLPSIGGSGSSFVTGAAASKLPSTALSVADVEQARANGTGRRLLRAKGEPFDAAAFSKTARAELAARAAAPAPAAAASPAPTQPTNEELQAGLERQKRKMGVKRLAAPPPPEVASLLKLRAGIDAQMLKASPPAPELGAAATPALLAQTDAVSGAAGAAPAAALKPLAVEKGAPVAAAALDAAPAAAEGLLLKSAEERSKAWSERGMHAAPPTVNFAVNMIALVVAPDLKSAVEIIGVETRGDRVVLRYRLFPRMAEVASVARSGSNLVRAYQFRVIPRTEKPVVFSRAD